MGAAVLARDMLSFGANCGAVVGFGGFTRQELASHGHTVESRVVAQLDSAESVMAVRQPLRLGAKEDSFAVFFGLRLWNTPVFSSPEFR
jgi:hypothetical protein